MTLSPCISLSFNGRCEAAFRFYERCLGGKIEFLLTWGDSPMAKDAPTEWSGKIIHARLAIGDCILLGGDVPPQSYERPRGFGLLLSVNDARDADRLFDELAKDGVVRVPFQETFWAVRYGAVTDQFGIPWEINCEKS
jgi:PhnB protein